MSGEVFDPPRYDFVNDRAQIDTSKTNIMPKVARERGGWDKVCVLDGEDMAFLVEAAVERFGEHCGVAQEAYKKATRALCRNRLFSVAHQLRESRNFITFFRNRTDEYLGDTLDTQLRYGQNGLPPSYEEMFGVDVETTDEDVTAWIDARALRAEDVAKLYRDLRRYDTRCTTGKSLRVNNYTATHSNTTAPIMPEVTDGYLELAPIVWGWKSNGTCAAFSNPGAIDSLTLVNRAMTNAVVIEDATIQEIGARMDAWCLADYTVYVRAGRRGGMENIAGGGVRAWDVFGPDVASRWIHLDVVSGYPPMLNRSLTVNADELARVVEHFHPGFGTPWAASEANVREKIYGARHFPQGFYNEDWTVEVAVTLSFRYAIGMPNWRMRVDQWLDYQGNLK